MRIVMLFVCVINLFSCKQLGSDTAVSLKNRYGASLGQIRERSEQDPQSQWLGKVLALLEQNTPDSLRSGSVLASAHVHQNEDEGPILIVYWIADVPDGDRFVLVNAAGLEEVVVPIHPVDYENNISEAATSVVFYASIRNQDLIDQGMQVDLSAVAAVALLSKSGARTDTISIVR